MVADELHQRLAETVEIHEIPATAARYGRLAGEGTRSARQKQPVKLRAQNNNLAVQDRFIGLNLSASRRSKSHTFFPSRPAGPARRLSHIRRQDNAMIASLMMRTSTILLLIGMLGGIVMGIQQNFLLAPAHAHLNLVGGVLLFLFGLYYKLHPAVAATTLAKVQGWLHIVGAVLFPAGIAIVLIKGPALEIAPIAGSLIVVAATALFAAVVFRNT